MELETFRRDEENDQAELTGAESTVWLCLYEYSSVASRLMQLGRGLDPVQDEEIATLWRKRAAWAAALREAPAVTVEEVLMKASVIGMLLANGELRVGLTPECLAQFDRALAEEEEDGRSLRELEPELWSLCQQVEKLRNGLEGRWDTDDRTESENTSLVAAWDALCEAVWSLTRYKAMTLSGLRAKGAAFETLLSFTGPVDGLATLQESYLRDVDHLAQRRRIKRKTSPEGCSIG